jgi:putative phosphoesterase
MATRVLVTADTHVPDFATQLPARLLRAASGADLILHAGDVTSAAVVDALGELAPVHVALGNNDGSDVERRGARPEVVAVIEDLSVAMVHDAGPRGGRERRLARRFPDADLIVFGHSHIPMLTRAEGRRFLNPGSPTWKRRQPAATYAVLTVDGRRVRARLIEVG